MSWVDNTAKALLLAYAMSASTPAFANEALASIDPKQNISIEFILNKNNIPKKNVSANEVTSALKGHNEDIEAMLKGIDNLLEETNTIYEIEGKEVRKSFFHSLDKGPPYSLNFNGLVRYKTMAPVDKVINATACIIDGDIHVSLKLTAKVEIYKWFIKAISIPPNLDFVIKPVRTDYGYDAKIFYSSEKPFVSKLATFFKGIYADKIEARSDGTPNNQYMLKMIENLKDKGLINVYDENYKIVSLKN